jgi:proline racemase
MAALAGLFLAGSAGAKEDGLGQYGWRNRVFLVFAPRGDPMAAEQSRILMSDPAELDERDLVVLMISEDGVTALHGKAEGVTAAGLRRDTGIATEAPFTAVLIGKDGGIKLRAKDPVAAKDLFGLIDGMPMRANERRR